MRLPAHSPIPIHTCSAAEKLPGATGICGGAELGPGWAAAVAAAAAAAATSAAESCEGPTTVPSTCACVRMCVCVCACMNKCVCTYESGATTRISRFVLFSKTIFYCEPTTGSFRLFSLQAS